VHIPTAAWPAVLRSLDEWYGADTEVSVAPIDDGTLRSVTWDVNAEFTNEDSVEEGRALLDFVPEFVD
jgi:hypothetical protein